MSEPIHRYSAIFFSSPTASLYRLFKTRRRTKSIKRRHLTAKRARVLVLMGESLINSVHWMVIAKFHSYVAYDIGLVLYFFGSGRELFLFFWWKPGLKIHDVTKYSVEQLKCLNYFPWNPFITLRYLYPIYFHHLHPRLMRGRVYSVLVLITSTSCVHFSPDRFEVLFKFEK